MPNLTTAQINAHCDALQASCDEFSAAVAAGQKPCDAWHAAKPKLDAVIANAGPLLTLIPKLAAILTVVKTLETLADTFCPPVVPTPSNLS